MSFHSCLKKTMNKESMVCSGTAKSATKAALTTSSGLLLAFVSGLFISLCTVIVKYVTNIHPGHLALYRFWAIASVSLPKLVLSQKNILGRPASRTSIIFLGISNASITFLVFLAFRHLPLGEAAVLTSCYPALVVIAARVFLKESFGILHIIAVAAVILGVMLISDFYSAVIEGSISFTAERIYGISAALGSLLFSTSFPILARRLKDIDPFVLLFTSAVIGCVECAIVTSLIGDFSLNYRGLQQWLIILLGLFSYVGQASLVMALQFGNAGPVTTMRAASDIVFSFIWQIILFGDKPSGLGVLGSILVCLSIFLVGFMQKLSSPLPQKCSKFC